MSSFN
ncbi:ee67cb25-aec9-4cbb-aaf8-d729318cbe01 [Thermothielavioides terrestris]